MSYSQNVAEELGVRLSSLASLFLACRDAFHETNSEYRWTAAPESPADLDANSLPSPDPLFVDRPGESGHRLLAEVVHTFLLAASGHLGALASLYESAEVVFSPPLLVRAIIENCAHAVWVLGCDPDEPSNNRLARCYLEELISAEEAKKNFGRMHGKASPDYISLAEDYRQLKSLLLTRFPGTTRASLGEHQIMDQRLPSPESAVKWMYSLTEAAGGTIGQDSASGIYGALSNRTHPTLYPTRVLRLWRDVGDNYRVADLEFGIDTVENEARAALAAFYNAMTYTTSYFGWSTRILDELEAKIGVIIPTFFR